MRSCWASIWFWSMLILTSFTAPLAALTTFSMAGCSCLQGPHHGAQKSTITGTVREASSTSLANLVWSLSFMRSAGAACSAAPFSMVSMDPRSGEFARSPAMWAAASDDARGPLFTSPVIRGRPGGGEPHDGCWLIFRSEIFGILVVVSPLPYPPPYDGGGT